MRTSAILGQPEPIYSSFGSCHCNAWSKRRSMEAQPLASKRLEVATVLQNHHWQKQLDTQGFSPDRLRNVSRVLNLITACRTGRMGSHLYRCALCQRGLMGMDHCDDRHCTKCGQERRVAWRKEMISWSLDCDYFHCVFTLPHQFNALIYANSRNLYGLLISTGKDAMLAVMRDEFGCVPGITQMLHTWGQPMNQHVHTHMIVTAGGLSLDSTQWITVDPNHPAIQPEHLAKVFRKKFLTRVGHRLRRNVLVWPTRSLLPEGDCHEALGLSSYEQMLSLCGPELCGPESEDVPPPDVDDEPSQVVSQCIETGVAPRRATGRQRELTLQEAELLQKLKAMRWVVDCQVTPPGISGPHRAISYLARYFTGVAISDKRLVSDSDGTVTFSYKDYRAGKERKLKSLTGAEFNMRFMLHILPRNFARVRHSGLFMPAGRDERLAKCRELLEMAKQVRAQKQPDKVQVDALIGDADASDDDDEEEVHKANSCHCRYCKDDDTELIGRLQGSETMWIMNVAHLIVMQLGTLLPVINQATVDELLKQVRSCWLTLRFLPRPIADLLRGQRFTPLEMAALEARLLHELAQTPMAAALGIERRPRAPSSIAARQSTPTSGVPPPAALALIAIP